MKAPLGYSHDGEFVTLRMTDEDHQMLLICLGVGWAGEMGRSAIELANRLELGNPHYTPMVDAEPKSGGKE